MILWTFVRVGTHFQPDDPIAFVRLSWQCCNAGLLWEK